MFPLTFGLTNNEYLPGEEEEHNRRRALERSPHGKMLLYWEDRAPMGTALEQSMHFQFGTAELLHPLENIGFRDEKTLYLLLEMLRNFLAWVIDPPANAGFPGDPDVIRSWKLNVTLTPRAEAFLAHKQSMVDVPFKHLFELDVKAMHDPQHPHRTHLPHMGQPHRVALTDPRHPQLQSEASLFAMWIQVSTPHLPETDVGRYSIDSQRVLAGRPTQHGPASAETLFHMRWFRPPQGRAYWDTATDVRREKADLFAEWPAELTPGYEQASEDYIVVRWHR